jgi:hypothetical protein
MLDTKVAGIESGLVAMDEKHRKWLDEANRVRNGLRRDERDSFSFSAYIGQNKTPADVQDFYAKYRDTFGSDASWDNVLDVRQDIVSGRNERKKFMVSVEGRPTHHENIGAVKKIASKILNRFGGAVGSVLSAGVGYSAGASATESVAEAVPGGAAVLAATQEKPGEAVFAAVEEVPVGGGLVSEVGRSLCHAAGKCETAEEGMLENLGRYLGEKAFDALHSGPRNSFNALQAPRGESVLTGGRVDMSSLDASTPGVKSSVSNSPPPATPQKPMFSV